MWTILVFQSCNQVRWMQPEGPYGRIIVSGFIHFLCYLSRQLFRQQFKHRYRQKKLQWPNICVSIRRSSSRIRSLNRSKNRKITVEWVTAPESLCSPATVCAWGCCVHFSHGDWFLSEPDKLHNMSSVWRRKIL